MDKSKYWLFFLGHPLEGPRNRCQNYIDGLINLGRFQCSLPAWLSSFFTDQEDAASFEVERLGKWVISFIVFNDLEQLVQHPIHISESWKYAQHSRNCILSYWSCVVLGPNKTEGFPNYTSDFTWNNYCVLVRDPLVFPENYGSDYHWHGGVGIHSVQYLSLIIKLNSFGWTVIVFMLSKIVTPHRKYCSLSSDAHGT